MGKEHENFGDNPPKIKRGRFDSLSLYEISDYELEILEKGTPSSIYLNFAIFLFSVAISFLIAITTTEIKSERLFSIYFVIVLVGFIIGGILIALWSKNRKSISIILQKIRDRIPLEEKVDIKTES